jgi:8-oxo-dGTP pyrophosphatase MutT (NUDIX family)
MAIRPAATTVAVRRSDEGPELMFVRRPTTLRAFGGFHAFPGGVVDPEDYSDEAAALSTLTGDEAAAMIGDAAGDLPALGFFFCALRELFEETGYEGRLTSVGAVLKDAYATNVKHVFAATDCRRVAEPEVPQLTEPALMALDDFREHLRGGRLTDVDAAYCALDHLGLL